MTPEHLHLLINHIPIHGLLFATLALIIGLFLKSKKVILTGTALILLSAISIPIVMGSGESAYDRYQSDPELSKLISTTGIDAAAEHYEHAEKGAKATYGLILISVLTLACARWKPAWFKYMTTLLLIVSILALALNMWIAASGGKIRRPDFSYQPLEISTHVTC